MKVLVTGATGFIGFHVARLLKNKGLDVSALARKGSGTKHLKAAGIKTIPGDIRDPVSVRKAVRGCTQVYHLAADYRLWVPDPETMYAINVQGTRNIMSASMDAGVLKVIYTSSVGTLAAGRNGTSANETTPVSINDMIGDYKRSKFIAEQEVVSFIKKGLPAIIVNPSTPIGAYDIKPTPTGKIIVDFINGRMPAYLDTGLNFVDVEDVAEGHWLAAQNGRIGEKYILGNRNMGLGEFLGLLAQITGRRPPFARLPYLPVLAAAYVNEAISKISKRPPMIPLAGVRMARKFMYFDCSKAAKELKMRRSPVEEAIEKAVQWFQDNHYILKGKIKA